MDWVTVQEIRSIGAASCGPRLAPLQAALLSLEESDPAVSDPEVTADISAGEVEVRLTIEADDAISAMSKAMTTLRTATESTGEPTPGWETAVLVMHVAPAFAADSLLAAG
ncbi:MAG TPA: hypothetical protein VH478_00325 [Trebonia sp.]|jgi:hypothetical protein|nr:hypothetical protein [Trebonia sp.]